MPDVVPVEPAPASEPAAEPADDDSDEAQLTERMRRSSSHKAGKGIDIGKNKMGAKGCDYIHETLQKRRNLTQRLRIVAKDQTGIKDLLIKDMIEDWWKKNEQERMNSKMTSAAESSMSSAD